MAAVWAVNNLNWITDTVLWLRLIPGERDCWEIQTVGILGWLSINYLKWSWWSISMTKHDQPSQFIIDPNNNTINEASQQNQVQPLQTPWVQPLRLFGWWQLIAGCWVRIVCLPWNWIPKIDKHKFVIVMKLFLYKLIYRMQDYILFRGTITSLQVRRQW